MRDTLIAILLLSLTCLAQTPKPKTAVIKSKALQQCEATSKVTIDMLGNSLEQFNGVKALYEAQKADNEGLAKRNEELRTAALQVLDFGKAEDAEYRRLLASYGTLVDRYNALLNQANQQMDQVNAYREMARQQRFANALAVYSLMPKFQPAQLPPPPQFNNNQFRCTSQRNGDFTYTSCN